MAISPHRVIRSTSCLVPGWGLLRRRIEWRYFLFSNPSYLWNGLSKRRAWNREELCRNMGENNAWKVIRLVTIWIISCFTCDIMIYRSYFWKATYIRVCKFPHFVTEPIQLNTHKEYIFSSTTRHLHTYLFQLVRHQSLEAVSLVDGVSLTMSSTTWRLRNLISHHPRGLRTQAATCLKPVQAGWNRDPPSPLGRTPDPHRHGGLSPVPCPSPQPCRDVRGFCHATW